MMASYRTALVLLLAQATVLVAQEPHLVVQPGSISKSLGETVYVSCTAKVDDPSLVTEMRWTGPSGRQIPSLDGSIETIEDGPGNLGLYIQKLKEQDTGPYNCTAVYAGNQNLRTAIDVKSFVSIDFGDTPTHQTPIVNSDALIKCTVTSSPSPQIDWLKDGIPFRTDDRHIIQQDGVLVRGITESDEGVYRCRARVAQLGALDSRDIQVEVLVPPEITTPPEDTSGVEKEAVTFQCVARGKPAPKYSWVDEQSRPLGGQEGYYVDEVKGELTILDLRPDQAGTYRCTASNPAGNDVAMAKLRVLTKPKLEQFLNITVDVKGNAEFRCVYSGDPQPMVIFQKETNLEAFENGVNADDRIEVTQTIDDYGHSVGIMTIREVVRADDGLYTCTGSSSGGDTVGWGHITVQFPPTFEQQPTNEFWSWEQEVVNITCLATSIPNATIQWYLRNKEIPQQDPNLRVMALGPVGVLQVNPLDNSYFGTYTCQATNTLGSVQNDISLKQVHKPGPIASAKVDKITATTVTWDLLEPNDNGGRPITIFLVQYKFYDLSWADARTVSWTKGSSYTLDNLTPQERYNFRFAAKNEVGVSEWSGEKMEQMPQVTVPEEPLIFVRGEGVNFVPYTDHYDLQWKAPLDNGDPINLFTVIYYQVVPVGDTWEVLGVKTTRDVKFPGPTTYTIAGLRPDTHYRIELRAHNNIGFSSPAELVIKTANAPCGADCVTSVVPADPNAPASGPGGAAYTEPSLGIGVVVAIAVVAALVLALVLDVVCFFCRDAGLTAALVHKVGSKEKDKEAMLETGKNNSEETLNQDGKPDKGSLEQLSAAHSSDLITEQLTEKSNNTNGSPKGDEKPPLGAPESVTQDRDKDAEPTEITPMIQGIHVLPDVVKEGKNFEMKEARHQQTVEPLLQVVQGSERKLSSAAQQHTCNEEFIYQNFKGSKEQIQTTGPYYANGFISSDTGVVNMREMPPEDRVNRPKSMTLMQTSRSKQFFQSMYNIDEDSDSSEELHPVPVKNRLAHSQADLLHCSSSNKRQLMGGRPTAPPPAPPTPQRPAPPPPLRSSNTQLSGRNMEPTRRSRLIIAMQDKPFLEEHHPEVNSNAQMQVNMERYTPYQLDVTSKNASAVPDRVCQSPSNDSNSSSSYIDTGVTVAVPRSVAFKIQPYRDVEAIQEHALSPVPSLYADQGAVLHATGVAVKIASYTDTSKFLNGHDSITPSMSTDTDNYQIPASINRLINLDDRQIKSDFKYHPRKISKPTDLSEFQQINPLYPTRRGQQTQQPQQNYSVRINTDSKQSVDFNKNVTKSTHNLSTFSSKTPVSQSAAQREPSSAVRAPPMSSSRSLGNLASSRPALTARSLKPSQI